MIKNIASIIKIFAPIACLLLAGISAFPQSQATTGNIEGRVTDPNGAGVPTVTITATNQETGLSKTTNADENGNYRITFLPPGKYRVTTTGAQGFAGADFGNVTVTVGGQTPLDIQLKLGATTTMVDVAAEGQIVETTRTSVSSTVNERAIQNLPVNGRNFLDFATPADGGPAATCRANRTVARLVARNIEMAIAVLCELFHALSGRQWPRLVAVLHHAGGGVTEVAAGAVVLRLRLGVRPVAPLDGR